MNPERAAARGRRLAEAAMTDACRIYAEGPGGKGTLGADGRVIKPDTTIYTGKCRVKAETGTSVGDVGAGETAVSRVTPIVSVPYTVTGLRAGQKIALTETADPTLATQTLLVRAVQTGSFITAHRLICEVL